MTDDPESILPSKGEAAGNVGAGAVDVSVRDVPHAPFIFYELAPATGYTNGIVNLTLSANRTWIDEAGRVVNQQVVVAYLRGSLNAVVDLRNAIDKALLIAAPAAQGSEGKAN